MASHYHVNVKHNLLSQNTSPAVYLSICLSINLSIYLRRISSTDSDLIIINPFLKKTSISHWSFLWVVYKKSDKPFFLVILYKKIAFYIMPVVTSIAFNYLAQHIRDTLMLNAPVIVALCFRLTFTLKNKFDLLTIKNSKTFLYI